MRLKFIYSNGKTYTATKIKDFSGNFSTKYVSYSRTRCSTLELKVEEHVVVNTNDVVAIEITEGLTTTVIRNPAFPKYVLDYTIKTKKQCQKDGIKKKEQEQKGDDPSTIVVLDFEGWPKPISTGPAKRLQEIFDSMRVPSQLLRSPTTFDIPRVVTNSTGVINPQTSG